MPTIAGLTAATSCTDADLLWINQGTGSDRDKKATIAQIVTGGLPSAIVALPAPTAPTGLETLPIVQSAAGKEISLLDAFSAMAANAPTGTDDETSSVLVKQGTTGKRLSVSKFVARGKDIAKNLDFYPTWDSGITPTQTPWSSITTAGRCVIHQRPGSLSRTDYSIDVFAAFAGVASSSTDNNSVVLSIPSGSLPSGWYTDMEARVPSDEAIRVLGIYRANNAVNQETTPVVCLVATTTISGIDTLRITLLIDWATLMPTNNVAGAAFWVRVELPDTGYLAGDI